MEKRNPPPTVRDHIEAVGPEDGVDPRMLVARAARAVDDRKARQLCRQVERTLSLTLGGDIDDDRIRDLLIVSVDPAPHSHHLMVTLQTTTPVAYERLLELEGVLSQYKGVMRSAIAAAVNRRKTPDISLRVINAPMA